MRRWLRTAFRPDVVRRSTRVALIVGTVLVLINYFDRWLNGDLTATDSVKMMLTFAVPYCVSTYASVAAILSGEQR